MGCYVNDIERFYDARANQYWDPFRELEGRDKDIFPLVPRDGGTVLEYGFGSGSLLVSLTRLFARAIGVELSQIVIDRCRQRIRQVERDLLSRIEFIKTDGVALPSVGDGSIDVVVCAAVIEHVFDPYALLDTLRRIAKPTARLILTTPNYAYVKNRLIILSGGLPRTGTDEPVERWRQCGWDGGHLHYFTQGTLAQLLSDCGWEAELWSGAGERWSWLKPLRRRFPSIFSGELIVRARAAALPLPVRILQRC